MKYCKLIDLCDEIVDCPHSTPNWKSTGIRVVRNFNLVNGRLDFTNGFYVDEKTYLERTRRAQPDEGDIIISREAPMGTVAIIPPGLKCCLGQRLVLIKVNKKICNPYYLLAVLMSDFVQVQFQRANVTGSTVSNLCIPDLKNIVVPILENGQNNLAKFYFVLSNKIENNTKITDNLIQMASTVYMHYFFERIPNGKLGSILIEHQKSNIQVGEAQEASGNVPFFTSGDSILKWDTALVDDRCCYLNTGGNADVKFYVGKAAYSTDTWCISGKDQLSDYLFLLLNAIKPELNKKFFQGTGLKHLQKPLLKDRPIYIPTTDELSAFNAQIMPMMTKISENTIENQQLIQLRDWLLPMLMNGQATVAD